MTKTTKNLIIIFLIIALVGGVFAYYFLSTGQKEKIDISPEKNETTTPQIQTELKDKNLLQLTQEYAISPTIIKEKNTIRYTSGQDGSIYEIQENGENKEKIPFVGLKNTIKTLWSSDGSYFINIYSDSLGVKRFFYDLNERRTTPLNSSIKWVDLSPKNNKIVYYYSDKLQNINSISIANPDGTKPETLINTRLKDLRISWINEDKIAITTAPSGLSENILYFLDINNPKLIKILSGVYGLTYKWSSDGSIFIYSQTDDSGNNLRLLSANSAGENKKELRIKTVPEKCVFSKDNITVFCAEPNKIPSGAIMPDDYYKKTFITNDTLWKINLETGKKDLIYQFDEKDDFDLANLILSEDEKTLFFTNRLNGFLYRLKID